jgi:predicted choloylglycine hydrolase
MIPITMTFAAVNEQRPGQKWLARWTRCWPSYCAWYLQHQHDRPARGECEDALARYMPELLPVYRQLLRLAGNSDIAACFLSHWRPPEYLSGCSVAAKANNGQIRLVRNYDLAPHLNEGLLLRSSWLDFPVMGMIEFLWGLSDGINAFGLCAAIAYGGRSDVAPGFGVTLILRHVLETCRTVDAGLAVLKRIPSHMAYNVTLADKDGRTASVELQPGGGLRRVWPAIATNHQHGPERAQRHRFTATHSRRAHIQAILADDVPPEALVGFFLKPPLFQQRYSQGFGTLFTSEYDPSSKRITLHWPASRWTNTVTCFIERVADMTLLDTLKRDH